MKWNIVDLLLDLRIPRHRAARESFLNCLYKYHYKPNIVQFLPCQINRYILPKLSLIIAAENRIRKLPGSSFSMLSSM
jgi:hypothetical protein